MQLGPKLRFVSNLFGYQISWAACVLGGTLPAIPVVGLFALWHSRMSRHREWIFIAMFALIGVTFDSVQSLLGVLTFDEEIFLPVPIWLVLLWCAFAMTLLHSMLTIIKSIWLSILLAGIAAPLSYFAGERLGVLSVSPYGYYSISIGWMIILGGTSYWLTSSPIGSMLVMRQPSQESSDNRPSGSTGSSE